jgi:eukaryotic-like serine/threonine-protein kinase
LRYASVESFAADVQRHLDGMPVLAQPPSRAYRLGKFVRRNRWPLAAAAALILSLAGGLAATLWQAREAQRQAAIAVAGLDRAEASYEFASAVLMEGIGSNETISIDQLLTRAAAIADQSFAGTLAQRAVSAGAVAQWLTVARRYPEAEALLARTRAALAEPGAPLADARAGVQSDVRLANLLRCQHGHVLARLGRLREGIVLLDAGIGAAADDAETASYCLHRRAVAAGDALDVRAELDYTQRALAAFEQSRRQSSHTRAHLLGDQAAALWANGRKIEAEANYHAAMREFEVLGRLSSQQALSVRSNWALSLAVAGDPRRSLQMLEEIAAAEQQSAPQGALSSAVRTNRALMRMTVGKLDAARADYQALLAEGWRHDNLADQARAQIGLMAVSINQGELGAAERHADIAADLLRRAGLPDSGPAPVTFRMWQARMWQLQGKPAEADAALATTIELLAATGARIGALSTLTLWRAEIALAQGRLNVAGPLADDALQIARAVQGDLPQSNYTGRALLLHARLAERQGAAAAASSHASEAIVHLRATVEPQHPLLVEAEALSARLR